MTHTHTHTRRRERDTNTIGEEGREGNVLVNQYTGKFKCLLSNPSIPRNEIKIL